MGFNGFPGGSNEKQRLWCQSWELIIVNVINQYDESVLIGCARVSLIVN